MQNLALFPPFLASQNISHCCFPHAVFPGHISHHHFPLTLPFSYNLLHSNSHFNISHCQFSPAMSPTILPFAVSSCDISCCLISLPISPTIFLCAIAPATSHIANFPQQHFPQFCSMPFPCATSQIAKFPL